MTDMVAVIIVAACVGVFLVGLFWYGLRGEQNVDPALGSNMPYPEGFGPLGAGQPFMATVVVSDAEQFRRNADRELTRRLKRPEVKARSWMEEPGAMEAAGLVDAPDPSTEAGVPADQPLHPHKHKKHH
jgi:hypothetical protein